MDTKLRKRVSYGYQGLNIKTPEKQLESDLEHSPIRLKIVTDNQFFAYNSEGRKSETSKEFQNRLKWLTKESN